MFAFSITAPRLHLRPCRRARPADEAAPARSPALAGAVDAPHLSAALIATGLAIAILAGGYRFSRLVESRYIHALAPQLEYLTVDASTYGLPDLMLKNQGLALQAEALRQPDLLPIYGSSELIRRVSQGPYHPGELFRRYPTGFTIFAVGRPGASPLITLQD